MKIAFVASEVVPFAKTGGLADVCHALPLALEKLNQKIVLVMPKYAGVNEGRHPLEKIGGDIFHLRMGKNVSIYFVEHNDYFNRSGLYNDINGDFNDNLERFQYLSRRALEVFKEIDFCPDVIHCHDWQTALVPLYLKAWYADDPFYKNTRSVLTIHNLAYQGVFPKQKFGVLGLGPSYFNQDYFEFYDQINLLKAGIMTADKLTTVSPRYAQEIQTKEFGCNLEGIIQMRGDDLTGILNGIDYDVWDPQKDSFLEYPYGMEVVDKKQNNKHYLQEISGLRVDTDIPLFGFIGRLTHQKGLDLIAAGMDDILHRDIQMVFLGDGEKRYADLLRHIHSRYPQKVALFLQFNEGLAHQIYAGSDILLMPSHYEPCGLNQMIALKYGTIPLVHYIGGLADTILSHHYGGVGFAYSPDNTREFLNCIHDAVDVFHDRSKFFALMIRAMSQDFSWNNSAREYLKLYESFKASVIS